MAAWESLKTYPPIGLPVKHNKWWGGLKLSGILKDQDHWDISLPYPHPTLPQRGKTGSVSFFISNPLMCRHWRFHRCVICLCLFSTITTWQGPGPARDMWPIIGNEGWGQTGIESGGPLLLIGCFASIYPITVNIHWFWKISNGSLEFFQADGARYYPCVSSAFHFDITGLLVVTKGTGELGVQVTRQFLFGRWLPLWLSASHSRCITCKIQ